MCRVRDEDQGPFFHILTASFPNVFLASASEIGWLFYMPVTLFLTTAEEAATTPRTGQASLP